MTGPRLGHYVEFYGYHLLFLVAACAFAVFRFRPELLDWIHGFAGVVAILWTILNSSRLPAFLGGDLFLAYRHMCVRAIDTLRKVSLALGLLLVVGGAIMFHELTARFQYVEAIKELTLARGSESLPYPAPADLAKAYNLYPHRKEVLFIVNRMSRLLAFDDETRNFNQFMDEFLKNVDVKQIEERYRDKASIAKYDGAIDPIVALARFCVESTENPASATKKAIDLLDTYRKNDEGAEFYRLVYEHDLISPDGIEPDEKSKISLKAIQTRIEELLARVRTFSSTKHTINLGTSHIYQELLDHYAQIRMETVNTKDEKERADAVRDVPHLYTRILTIRQTVANATDAPWLETAGKFTIFHLFKHAVGRSTPVTIDVRKTVERIPGLSEELEKRVIGAEAFKEFRDLSTWDKGTPRGAAFAGTGMNKKMLEWLKEGW